MEDCRQFVAKFWLFIVNGLLLTIGVIMIALGGTGLASTKEMSESESGEALSAVFSPRALEMLVAGGALTIVIAAIGMYAAKHSTAASARIVLFIYGALMILIIGLEVAGGVVALNFAGELDTYGKSARADEYTDKSIEKIDNGLEKAMSICCDEEQLANEAIAKSCKLIKAVVNPKDGPPGCDSFENFKSNFIDYANRKARSIALFGLVVGVLQLLALISACYLVKNKGDAGLGADGKPSSYGSFEGGKSA